MRRDVLNRTTVPDGRDGGCMHTFRDVVDEGSFPLYLRQEKRGGMPLVAATT
jgi:hypothetical protein